MRLKPMLLVLALLTGAPAFAQPHLVAATALLGAKVLDTQGAGLGHVTDLVFEPRTGEVRYAVVFANADTDLQGEDVFAVPLQALRPGVQRDRLVLADPRARPAAGDAGEPLVRAQTLLGSALLFDLMVDLEDARIVSAVLQDDSGARRRVPFREFARDAAKSLLPAR